MLGIRHHGPGSARSLLAALAEFGPDAVLIEGPADADPLVRWVLADGMRPPVALLGVRADSRSGRLLAVRASSPRSGRR